MARTRHDLSSAERKQMPTYRGFAKYFPDAMMAVSMLSLRADRKHSPEADPEDMDRPQWIKHASADHGDCLIRHQMDVGTVDAEMGLDYYVHVAWRGMAQLQAKIDKDGIDSVINWHWNPMTSERTDSQKSPPPAEGIPPVEAYKLDAPGFRAATDQGTRAEPHPGKVIKVNGPPHLFTREELARDLEAGTRYFRHADSELEGPDV